MILNFQRMFARDTVGTCKSSSTDTLTSPRPCVNICFSRTSRDSTQIRTNVRMTDHCQALVDMRDDRSMACVLKLDRRIHVCILSLDVHQCTRELINEMIHKTNFIACEESIMIDSARAPSFSLALNIRFDDTHTRSRDDDSGFVFPRSFRSLCLR